MTHQRSPNRWSCLPTSLAMVLDVPVRQLIEKLGHDGSEILWPDQPEPIRRRGFHVEELQYVCRKYSVVLACFVPRFGFNPVGESHDDCMYDLSEQFNSLLSQYCGILTGCYRRSKNLHAVAWSAAEECIYDPDDPSIRPPIGDWTADSFYALCRIL